VSLVCTPGHLPGTLQTGTTRRDPYTVLGASRTDDERTIRTLFRRKSLELHPDRPGGDAAAFLEAADAFDTLSDAVKRRHFDEGRSRWQPTTTQQPAREHEEALFTEEDAATCGYYFLLLLICLVTAAAAIFLIAGTPALADRLRIFASIQTAAALLPLLLWARARRLPVPASSTSWAQYLIAQAVGSASGVLTVGVLVGLTRGLRTFIGIVGHTSAFPQRDGSTLICILVFCVKQE